MENRYSRLKFYNMPYFLILVNVKITTKNWGYEISWRLIDKLRGGSTCGGSHYASNNGGADIETCRLESGMYELRCEDSWGDGWNGGYLEIGGTKYCDNFLPDSPNMCAYLYTYGCNTLMIRNVTISGNHLLRPFYFAILLEFYGNSKISLGYKNSISSIL